MLIQGIKGVNQYESISIIIDSHTIQNEK